MFVCQRCTIPSHTRRVMLQQHARRFRGNLRYVEARNAEQESRFAVQKNTSKEYSPVTKGPSPFPQHKGHPMWFGAVKLGKAYVSFHLMPLYMSPTLEKEVSPALKKRMQGKTCFKFKNVPDASLIADLKRVTELAARAWDRF